MAGEEDLLEINDKCNDVEELSSLTEKKEAPRPSVPKVPADNIYWHGPHATGYENFIQGLYKVGKPYNASTALNSYTSASDLGTSLPPSLLLKIEALSANGIDSYDSKYSLDSSKTSNSFSADNRPPPVYKSQYAEDYSSRYGNYKSEFMRNMQTRLDDEAKNPKPKLVLLDRKKYGSSPLSKHLYSDEKYVHREDSRIVGSDFVMLTLRPNDNFLNKIDKTLAEARKVNSWDM